MAAARALTLTAGALRNHHHQRAAAAAAGDSVAATRRIEQRVFRSLSMTGSVVAAAAPMEEAVLVKSPVERDAEVEEEALPELLTEYMVDMKCMSCVNSVTSKLEPLPGVKSVSVDLSNQVVRVLGTAPVKIISAALEQTGRNNRLIGQGSLQDFGVSAAVVEFKGPQIHGVVRFAQVSMELVRIEATFTGLSPGIHGWSINSYGDLTRGAASTGKIYTPESETEAVGDLGVLVADETGRAEFTGTKKKLRITDLIGRALVVYGSEDKSVAGMAAAVIARSAGVGENYKKLCSCDGTIIWES